MAPNKFFHNLKHTIKTSIRFIPCPACDRQLKNRGGLRRHLNSAHPGFKDHVAPDSPTNNEGSGSDSTTRNEHRQYSFVYTRDRTGDQDALDYINDDHDDPTNDTDDNPPSPSHNVPSAFPDSPVRPASPENAGAEDVWETGSPSHKPNSTFSPSPVRPASPEDAHMEDAWRMDVDQDIDDENEDSSSSSSSNISHPAFSDESHSHANRPTAGRRTVPEQKYTRLYHQKLDGKRSLHLYSTI